MIQEYLPILLLVGVTLLFASATLLLSKFLSQKGRNNPAKNVAYECGLPPLMGGHPRFSVKFYLVAMLFILFDIEVVFLYPWAVVYREMLKESLAIFFSMFSFLGILFIGFIYAVKKGALDWK